MTQRIVGSYTFFNELENCPFKAYNVRVARTVPYVSSPEAEHGNRVHDAMEKRVGDGVVLPEDLARLEPFALCFDGKQVKTELKLGIQANGLPTKFFGEHCYVGGKIDVTWTMALNHVDITDWKTGKEDYETSFELELHALLHAAAVAPIAPRYTARFAYIARAKRPDKIGRTYDTADGSMATPQQTWAKVNSLMARAYDFASKGHWPKTPNPLCGWCAVMSCEYNKSEARKLKEGAKP